MTLTLFLVILAAIVLPAMLGWWLARSFSKRARLVATLAGGLLIVLPYFFAIARVESIGHDPDAMMAIWIYAALAVVVGLGTYALLERSWQEQD